MASLLSPEQIALRDSFHSLLAEKCGRAVVRRYFDGADTGGETLWRSLMELGVLEYFDQEGGGGVRDLGLLAFEAGYALLPENLVDSAAAVLSLRSFAPQISSRFGGAAWKELIAGQRRIAVAPPGFSPPGTVTAKFVSAPHTPSLLLLVSGGDLMLHDLAGAALREERCIDRTERRYEVALQAHPPMQFPGGGHRFTTVWGALKSAELAGAAKAALDMTVEYAKTREQFDVPIGGFQAVQHAAADMMVKAEAMRALSDFACWAADNSVDQLELAARSAALFAAEEAPKVVEKAIQLHGGIGFTWEHDLHLYLRRVRTAGAILRHESAKAPAVVNAARLSQF